MQHLLTFTQPTSYFTFHNSRVSHQRTLHLERTDAVAATLDNIIGTTNEPVIAVFIAPCNIACIVDSVMPSLFGQFPVTVIFLEESQGFALICANNNLSFLTFFCWSAVRF